MVSKNEMSHPTEIIQSLKELWKLDIPISSNLFSEPAFVQLRENCKRLYPNSGERYALDSALATALQTFGLPHCYTHRDKRLALKPEYAAELLINALRQNRSMRFHLCPLDLASDWPDIEFGPNKIVKMSAAQLEETFDTARLNRINSTWNIDVKRLCKFHWLVIREDVQLDGVSGARKVPDFLNRIDFQRDFGEIQPHKMQFSPVVESALLALLLLPWEDTVDDNELDWRGFRVPWVYTVDEDIFVRAKPPPSPDTLSWDYYYFDDGNKTIECETPSKQALKSNFSEILNQLNHAKWSDINLACKTPLFQTPVVHFFVRAFMNSDIDEFLAHMTTIEASLGLQSDYSRKKSKSSSNAGRKNMSATKFVGARLSALLEDRNAGKEYCDLFNIRSAYLHGRTLDVISSKNRNLARRLAQKAVNALIGKALTAPAPYSRDEFISNISID